MSERSEPTSLGGDHGSAHRGAGDHSGFGARRPGQTTVASATNAETRQEALT